MRLQLVAAVTVALSALALGCGGGDGGTASDPDADVDTGIVPPPSDASDDGSTTSDATTDAVVDTDAATDGASDGAAADADAGPVWPIACMLCHGSVNPAPPLALNSATSTSDPGVGAHQSHLGPSSWHHELQCDECHVVPQKSGLDPAFPLHRNGKTDLVWGPIAKSGTYATTTCTGTYCHGATLKADKLNTVSNRTPNWITVDGSQKACGTSCHTLPPGGGHTSSTACETCHSAVVTSFTPGNPPTVVWKDASLHINGKLELSGQSLTCTSCHGDTNKNDPMPPRGTKGETLTSQLAVGAHAQHLAASTWHRNGVCADCHTLPGSTGHSNGITDFTWGPVSTAGGALPNYTSPTCTSVYCHGTTLKGPVSGGQVSRSPVWNVVNGTYNTCGDTCHTNPPGGSHPLMKNCPTCHGAVIATYNPLTKVATWTDSALHIDGIVEVGAMTCTSCHGDTIKNDPSPPLGTKGETLTSQLAVGAHAQHLGPSTWHRTGACTDCHTVPGSTGHSNGVTDFNWGPVSTAGGALPAYGSPTCTSVYCHGTTLKGPVSGGQVSRSPVWNVVNGTYDTCGNTCHTNPPGGAHPPMKNCPTCHGAVIATYNPLTMATTWTSPALHVNGTVEVIPMTCTTCHGTGPSQINPPTGVEGESTTGTLAVGRHVAHLAASSTHVAFACNTCHVVPGNGDTTHASGYLSSPTLATAGHHGDVTFANQAVGMTFNVAATQGAPVTARGTCLGACHSNGRGGAPLVTPYWAGGAWNVGSCASCHPGTMSGLSERHPTHNGEATCADCHPAANSPTHLNGTHDVNPTIIGSSGGGGGSVTTLPPGALGNNCPAGQWQCTGTCHGKDHTPRCWQ